MMRRFLGLLILYCSYLSYGHVLLNEVYYDHTGSDTGYEWLEIYNPHNLAVDITDWRIEAGGSEFDLVCLIPPFELAPHSYFLIGESEVDNADWQTVLQFQNGGSATDGIRLISADSLWTDTVLYDFPNANQLVDDTGEVGSSFAPDVQPGNSIGRFPNAYDSNNGSDWRERKIPTPGERNTGEIDLMIEFVQLQEVNGYICLFTMITNVSTEGVDNLAGCLDIFLNETPWQSIQLPIMEAAAHCEYEMNLCLSDSAYYVTELELNSLYDHNISNNSSGASLLKGDSFAVINELMIRPHSNKQEWVEIFLTRDVDNFVDNLVVYDAAGNFQSFNVTNLLSGYYLIGSNPAALAVQYDIDESVVLSASGLPGLNNTGDILVIADEWGTILDSICYDSAAGATEGISYERQNPFTEDSQWGLSRAEAGHTAGLPNSIMCGSYDAALKVLSVQETDDFQLLHTIEITNLGINNIEEGTLKITRTDLSTQFITETEEFITWAGLTDTITVYTEIPSSGYYQFDYLLEAEEDTQLNNNVDSFYFNRESLPWVINEIMYHPFTGEPEWLEIKRNLSVVPQVGIELTVDNDTCRFSPQSEYVIITGSPSDCDFLQMLYGSLEVYSGMGSLLDEGSSLALLDEFGNSFENFTYDKSWGEDLKGVSLERINPLLPARENNWGRCLDNATPGAENSLYMEYIPAETEVSVQPEVFSPALGESTFIAFRNSQKLNKIKIRIYDLKGREIARVADEEMQGMEGCYVWNGKNQQGKTVPVGIYIILLESSAGQRSYTKKATVTVAW